MFQNRDEELISRFFRENPPEFFHTGAILTALPQHERNDLKSIQRDTLCWCLFFFWRNAFHSGRGRIYYSTTQSWLGEQLGKSRFAVMRAMKVLIRKGFLRSYRQSPKGRKFRPNKYEMGSRMWGLIPTAFWRKTSMFSACALSVTQQEVQTNKDSVTDTTYSTTTTTPPTEVTASTTDTAHSASPYSRMEMGPITKIESWNSGDTKKPHVNLVKWGEWRKGKKEAQQNNVLSHRTKEEWKEIKRAEKRQEKEEIENGIKFKGPKGEEYILPKKKEWEITFQMTKEDTIRIDQEKSAYMMQLIKEREREKAHQRNVRIAWERRKKTQEGLERDGVPF